MSNTYEVALILTVDADSPQEAAETAYRWCTDTELEPPTMLVLPALANDYAGILFGRVEELPGVIAVDLSEQEQTP